MGLVLWIDQNSFATGLLEKVFRKKDLAFYTLSSATDFKYLVEDLKPGLMVVDTKTALTDLSLFKAQYQDSEYMQTLPVVWVDGESNDLDFVKNVVGKIPRPFDPFIVPDLLKNFLETH